MTANNFTKSVSRDDIIFAGEDAKNRWKGPANYNEDCDEQSLAMILVNNNFIIDTTFLKHFWSVWSLRNPFDLHDHNKMDLLCRQLTAYAIDIAKTTNASNPNYNIIEDISLHLERQGLTNGRQTSLISKLALSISPETYPPTDLNARKALRAIYQLKPVIDKHDYKRYIREFENFFVDFKEYIITHKIPTPNLSTTKLSNVAFLKRWADKTLHHIGKKLK